MTKALSLEYHVHPAQKQKDPRNRIDHFQHNLRSAKVKGSARMRRGKIPGRHH